MKKLFFLWFVMAMVVFTATAQAATYTPNFNALTGWYVQSDIAQIGKNEATLLTTTSRPSIQI